MRAGRHSPRCRGVSDVSLRIVRRRFVIRRGIRCVQPSHVPICEVCHTQVVRFDRIGCRDAPQLRSVRLCAIRGSQSSHQLTDHAAIFVLRCCGDGHVHSLCLASAHYCAPCIHSLMELLCDVIFIVCIKLQLFHILGRALEHHGGRQALRWLLGWNRRIRWRL